VRRTLWCFDEQREAPSAGAPDAYVAYWDGVNCRAFTAAALGPAEGHVIFAYVAVAVYDSVMAVEGGYEPFAVDLGAPEGTSARPRSRLRLIGYRALPAPRRR
jgi:hypothetical protein